MAKNFLLYSALAVVALLLLFPFSQREGAVGGYIAPSGDITSRQISCGGSLSGATTTVWGESSTSSYRQIAYIENLSPNGDIYLDFGTNDATTTSGFFVGPSTSTQNEPSFRVITQPTMLLKRANCVATVTSTLNIFGF